jgi:hypothetical protein
MNHHTTHQGVKVKPTEQIANSASTPKAGLFATLRALLHAAGSGAQSRALLGTFLITLCALFGLNAVAQAEAPKLVPNGNFAADTPLPIGVAVDQSTNDVYVAGLIELSTHNPGHVDKFDALDNLLSPPSPFGEAYDSGVAVNPTNGDVYVLGEAGFFAPTATVYTYDPNTGLPVSSFTVEATRNLFGVFTAVQIATDSAGNVYVPQSLKEEPPSSGTFVPNDEVHEYDPATCPAAPTPCVPLKTFTGGSGAGKLREPSGVAVDSSGNVWVADAGNNRIEELGPTGTFIGEIKSEGVRSIALDGHGDVLAIVNNNADPCGVLKSPCAHLVEYSSSGVQLADVGAGYFESVQSGGGEFSMVAVDQASGRVYVTDGFKSLVWIFQPPVAPVLGQESAVEVGTVEAKLGALVNPGGAETTYRFEYDTREYTEGEGSHGVSVPFPEGSAGQGFSSRTAWASAKGLEPGTTYHYRAVVTNGVGTAVGPDQTFTTETVAQTACPNEQSRGEFSAALPDCRAYEAVVPPNKASAQPITPFATNPPGGTIKAANDGNRFTWVSNEVLPGSKSAQGEFLATRGASGWSAESAVPLQSYNGDRCALLGGAGVVAFSPDLSKSVIKDNGEAPGAGNTCRGGEIEEVVPGETPRVQNLLLRDNTTGAYQLIDVPPPGVEATNAGLIAVSADLNLVVFNDGAALTPEAPNGGNFEWNEGVVRLLQFTLPSGAPVAGSLVSISPDGSDLFFTADGNLYVRVNRERTIQLDQARGGSGPGGGGSFAGLTADGSQVFFTDDASAGLTEDTVPGSGPNLYRYDVGTRQLSDLTPVAHAEAGLTGISEDGSYVYFTAKAVMSGSQANQFGETAESGQSNLYLSHGGTITFVMHGGGEVSPNGAYLAFGGAGSKIELYSAAANRFECASCNPFGVATAVESRSGVSNNGQVFFQTAAALLPRDTNGVADVSEYDYAGGLHLISTGTSSSESRLLGSSDSGNDVFFLGRQALLPGESNEESLAVYDARVDGGFPVTAVPVCTTADACRTAPAPQPLFPSVGVGTAAVFGEDNLSASPPPVKKVTKKTVKCKKNFVRKRVKKKEECVRKPKKAKKANRRAK